MQLKAQFDEIYPGAIDAELNHAPAEIDEGAAGPLFAGCAREAEVRLIDSPADPVGLLDAAMRFGRRFSGCDAEGVRALIRDARPRELEALHYCFRIDNVSLACVTHFTRHRMLSMQLRHELSALAEGNYVLPASVAAQPRRKTSTWRRFPRNPTRRCARATQGRPACSSHILRWPDI